MHVLGADGLMSPLNFVCATTVVVFLFPFRDRCGRLFGFTHRVRGGGYVVQARLIWLSSLVTRPCGVSMRDYPLQTDSGRLAVGDLVALSC